MISLCGQPVGLSLSHVCLWESTEKYLPVADLEGGLGGLNTPLPPFWVLNFFLFPEIQDSNYVMLQEACV